MKIVNVEDFFHPEAGYQLDLLSKYHQSFGHEVTIITAEMGEMPYYLTNFFDCTDIEKKDEAFNKATGVKIIRLPIRTFVSGRALFWKRLIKTIQEEKPDIVYAHGNDTYTAIHLLLFRKLLHCPIVTDSHMVDMASSNRFRSLFRLFYKTIVTPIIIKSHIPVIRTAEDDYVEKRLGIPLSQAPVISFGSDTLLFHPDRENRVRFREENGIDAEEFVIVYAGKLDEGKGGLFFARAIEKKLKTKRPVTFLIVGNTCGEHKKEIERLFKESQNKIIRFPTQKYQDLAQFFQAADLAVFPKQCSLSFFDVQACGLPVLSEDNPINIPRCSHGNGWNFIGKDLEDFRKKMTEIVDTPIEEYDQISKKAEQFIVENYNYEERARDYEKVLNDTFRRYNGER